MDIEKLEYILALQKEQSFKAAADKLYVSPQSFSTVIKSLEEDFGVQLFERNKWHGAVITPKGSRVAAFAKHILQEYNDFCQELREDGAAETLKGELNIYYNDVFLESLLEAITTLQKQNSQIAITTRKLDSGDILEHINRETGNFVALLMLTREVFEAVKRKCPNFYFQHLQETTHVLAVRKDSYLARYKTITLQEVLKQSLVQHFCSDFKKSPVHDYLQDVLDNNQVCYSLYNDRNLWLSTILRSECVAIVVPEYFKREELENIKLIPIKPEIKLDKVIIYPKEPDVIVQKFLSNFFV